MVSEVYKSILEELGKLPEGHPDRDFLAREQVRFDTYLSPTKKEDLSLVEAQARINKMVQEDNPAEGVSQKVLERNIQMRQLSRKDSVAYLLPVEWLNFAGTVNFLQDNGIYTKEELINTPSSLIIGDGSRKIRGMGPKRTPFVLAMRDLAIAEMRE